ncbi:MAG TPA: phospholipase D-like domain-containing protein, partial [Jatrophihabitans sp.]|nr:phospholipase D-like domain-containing protein [Jatrophihabitans sp.]
ALYRRRNGVEECVQNYLGFAGDDLPAPQPSSVWPIQRLRWTDHLVDAGDEVSYRVVARVGASRSQLQDGESSQWTSPILVTPGAKIGVYFNRGIIASQWVTRLLGGGNAAALDQRLNTAIAQPGDPARNALSGMARERLLGLLASARRTGAHVYASIYELDDPELIAALLALGPRAHVILANGSKQRIAHTSPAQYTDGNEASRAQLANHVDLYPRLVDGEHLCHHKFAVVVTGSGPRRVWTGSTNWTQTGLCTQANNGLLVESRSVAAAFYRQWQRLRDAGSAYPASLLAADDVPATARVDGARVTTWFAPTTNGADLDAARAVLDRAQHGILFVMFNPGPANTLLTKILELRDQKTADGRPRLYVRGVINQDPGGAKHPVLRYGPETHAVPLDKSVLLPAAIEHDFGYWRTELRKLSRGFAMVHSKVIVVDPFGPQPVLITGSHNMGPKASRANDDNLVIIEGHRAAAAAHACVIMTIYDTYHWREWQLQYAVSHRQNVGTHLRTSGSWQTWPLVQGGRQETDFWFGG